MPNAYPTLDSPAKGSADKYTVAWDQLADALTLNIGDADDVYPNGSVYAVIADSNDAETPHWSGKSTHSISAGEWNIASDDPEQIDLRRCSNLRVQIPKKVLEQYVGQTLYVGYSSDGESGMVINSPTIALTIT